MTEERNALEARTKLGDILLHLGIITPVQLEVALRESDPDQKNLGQVLVALGYATEEKIQKGVSIRLGIPYFNSFEGLIEPEAVKLIPERIARKNLSVPIFKDGDSLTVGMVNPIDINAIDELTRAAGVRVQPVMAPLADVCRAIEEAYSGKPAPAASAKPAAAPAEAAPGAVREAKENLVRFQAEEKSVGDIIESLLQDGMSRRASDIHVEPADGGVRTRFRVDGMLQDGKTFPRELESAMAARIKILSQLDITETRLPQDGRLRFEYGGRPIDVRVSSVATAYGEKIVLRLLDPSRAVKPLSELGFPKDIQASFSSALKSANGIVLVTGPTGSGKTTTLYSAISELNDQTRNIVTLEDPIEYRIDRINQIEANDRIGLTFAVGLRAVLRQDPNVILVGEIRDLETAEIAMQSAITGHLVLSTLHTNDSVSTIHRLLNMRVEPFMIAAALRGVLAQRLLRRLCPDCKKTRKVSDAEAKALDAPSLAGRSVCDPAGCAACLKTGYKGRVTVHEWLPMGRAVRELILQRASLDELREAARGQGARSLRQSALEKAALGDTSLEEVLRGVTEGLEA